MRFERGVTIGDMRVCEELESELWGEEAVDELIKGRKTGTEVRFLPDDTVFKDKKGKPGIIFDREILEKRIDEIAYLNAGLTVTLLDERGKKPIKKVFYHAGGLAEYVGLLCEGKTPLFQISSAKGAESGFVQEGATITLTSTIDDVSASVALRWSSDQYAESILSFCNNIRTRDGGSHVEALKTTLTRTINNLGRSRKLLKDKNLPGDYIREGLTAIISVSLPDPEFEGQTKSRLGNPEIRALDAVLVNQFTSLFDFHPTILEKIIEKANQALNAANAARAARELVRRKSSLTSTILPGKLADCANRDPAESEIFIVEGDSAAGSAKQGRNRANQAILPLRGKILNVERASPERIYQNQELQNLISALGLGMRDTPYDRNSLRYHKVVIMTDADVDGAHIRALLLTFFYRYQREMIEDGFVFIAQPPLYKIVSGRKEQYAYTEETKDAIIDKLPGKKNHSSKIQGVGRNDAGAIVDHHHGSHHQDTPESYLGRLSGCRRYLAHSHGRCSRTQKRVHLRKGRGFHGW